MTSPPHPEAAYEVLSRGVADGVVPGGVAVVVDASGPGTVAVAGVRREGGPSVTADTRYDVASLTKVMATLPSVLRLVADGRLDLDEPLAAHFSNAGWFQTPSLGDATSRQLLAHTSGISNWTPLFAQVSTRATALANVLQARVEAPGRARYTDLGFMLLGALVERLAKCRLDQFARKAVFEPLGLFDTRFGPVQGVPVAATEECGWRGRLLEGEVHDENASVWEGVAGHAGLFSTAHDVAAYASAWLRLDDRLGPATLLRETWGLASEGEGGVRRGLGWLLAHPGVFSGAASSGFGHTGFTGTSLWIDPSAGRASVLLTNRVHPHRSRGGGIAELRRRFHGAAHGWAS
ncbi:MAG: beta-lactamase family protein [Trueperaceae bacterium]|nr:beta-lactamase family protein [Trueperaceae bacterium]